MPALIGPDVSTCLQLDCVEPLPLKVRYQNMRVWHTLRRNGCDVAATQELTQNVVFTGSA